MRGRQPGEVWGKRISSRGNSKSKGTKRGKGWTLRTVGRPVWLRTKGRVREEVGRGAMSCRFHPSQEGGRPYPKCDGEFEAGK